MYESCIKRLLYLILSLAACVVLAIPMGIIALWIKKDSPGPVFFKQRRVGRGKKCFNILKFRTMRGDTPHDVPTHLLKNADSYITKSGAFLRRTSLDELPELWDIFRGKMSIVGPRPLLVEYLLYYTADERHRHDVRPGLTGLAQINGRNTLTWEQKFAYDLEYVQHISFIADLRILLGTVGKVLNRSGVQVNTQSSEGNLARIRSCVGEKVE